MRLADLPDHLKTAGALAAALPRVAGATVSSSRAQPRAPSPGRVRGWRCVRGRRSARGSARGLRRASACTGRSCAPPLQERHDAEEELARARASSRAAVELAFSCAVTCAGGATRAAERATSRSGRALRPVRHRVPDRPGDQSQQVGACGATAKPSYPVEIVGAGGPRSEPAPARRGGIRTAVSMGPRHERASQPQADLRFDALAALLYVDRRGAPESRSSATTPRQGDTARGDRREPRAWVSSGRLWVTEVKLALAEGPHAPPAAAWPWTRDPGRTTMVRYYLAVPGHGPGGAGLLVASSPPRGYRPGRSGRDGALRRRPAHAALAHAQSASSPVRSAWAPVRRRRASSAGRFAPRRRRDPRPLVAAGAGADRARGAPARRRRPRRGSPGATRRGPRARGSPVYLRFAAGAGPAGTAHA